MLWHIRIKRVGGELWSGKEIGRVGCAVSCRTIREIPGKFAGGFIADGKIEAEKRLRLVQRKNNQAGQDDEAKAGFGHVSL